jgi:arginase family enzyme
MKLVPVLFPSDLGRSDRGRYVEGGERGAPDRLLDMLESEGVRLARPVTVPVQFPEAPDPEDAPLKFDAWLTRAVLALADAVEAINAEADFPLILGGDHTTLLGHVLGHSRRHRDGLGLAVLADAYTDLATPAVPVHDDRPRLNKDAEATKSGNAHRMVLSGALRMIPDTFELGRAMQASTVLAAQTSVVGVRAPTWAQIRANERKAGVDVWRMERLELDGEAAYRSMLTRQLARGPIVLSIDVGGLDPDLMVAVRNPRPDGLDWSFLKRSLEQCLPHIDRVAGLDIAELDPTRDDAHQVSLVRFAETLAPFLKRIAR